LKSIQELNTMDITRRDIIPDPKDFMIALTALLWAMISEVSIFGGVSPGCTSTKSDIQT